MIGKYNVGVYLVSFIANRPNLNLLDTEPKPSEGKPNYKKYTEQLGKFRGQMENTVRHQFYLLFAPLGSIFVYQMLVAGKAADAPVTVALAALGSGAALNLIPDKAVNIAKDRFTANVEKK